MPATASSWLSNTTAHRTRTASMLNLNENFNFPGTSVGRAEYYSHTLFWTLAWSGEIRTAVARSAGESAARRRVRSGAVTFPERSGRSVWSASDAVRDGSPGREGHRVRGRTRSPGKAGLFCQCGHCFGAHPSGRCRQFAASPPGPAGGRQCPDLPCRADAAGPRAGLRRIRGGPVPAA